MGTSGYEGTSGADDTTGADSMTDSDNTTDSESTDAEGKAGPDNETGTDNETDTKSAGGWRDRLRVLRPVVAAAATGAALLLVMYALVAPERMTSLTPRAFARIPIEGLLAAALVLVLPPRPRRIFAVLTGLGLGLLTLVKLVDMGFLAVLARPFDLVLDWSFFGPAVDYLTESSGRAAAIGAVAGAVLLALAVLALMTLSVLRLTKLTVRHNTTAVRLLAVLGVAWLAFAAFGVQARPGLPVAAKSAAGLAYGRVLQVRAGLQDRQAFAEQAAVDAFRDTPGDQLLTGLRGKDVVFTFVESYGRDAIEDPRFAPQVDAVLDAGTRELANAGFTARSAFLTSSTSGGGSWLAHATFLSGLQINNLQRYRNLVSSDRLTLTGAFRRADWRTVAVMPGISRAWPDGTFYGYERVYDSRNVGYRGPRFSWAAMPDQYTLATFERLERGRAGRPPLMAEIALVSSHSPWTPIPSLVGWPEVGDGSVFGPMARAGESPDAVWGDHTLLRTQYRRAIEYSLNTLISYVRRYGDDDLVLVFLGDHQAAPLVIGEGATRDVPVTIVARDRAVLDRIAGWGWQEGLRPGRDAPVWPMSGFRDRFLTAFGPRSQAMPPPLPTTR